MSLYEYPDEISSAEKKVRFLIKLVGYGFLAYILYEASKRSFGFQ